jgi:hypothetical protein
MRPGAGRSRAEPELAVRPAGSVLVTSKNEAIGRDRAAALRLDPIATGDLRVAGSPTTWRHARPRSWGRCDLNLLSGRGVETAGRAPWRPPPALLWDWRQRLPPPWADLLG